MSRKKKRPLPPRTRRMDRPARLQSPGVWLVTQRGRPAERIARMYRTRYGVDWRCAIAELSTLGVSIDPKWREQLKRTLAGAQRGQARRRAERGAAQTRPEPTESDDTFASIAGYTEGGAPFGVTWDECARLERGGPNESEPAGRDSMREADESPPF